jgi:hypothetical protein
MFGGVSCGKLVVSWGLGKTDVGGVGDQKKCDKDRRGFGCLWW